MLPKLQNKNLSWKSLITLFLIVCYWFYLSICFGYFLSKIFHNFFDIIDKTSLSKSIKFRKKFNFKNIIKIIIGFFLKLIKNWFIRIRQKFLLLIDAINGLIIAVKIFLKKFKSLLKFKYNFRLLKNLLPIFWETFLILCSFVNEILLLSNIIDWVSEWGNLIRLFMQESVFITRLVYGLFLILLGIFGVLLGFLLGVYWRLGVYRREDEIYVFLLLLLLKILYNNGFDDVLLEPLRIRSLEPHNIEEFSKFSLQVFEPSNLRPSKLFFKELVEKPQIPFPLLGDPVISIDVDFLFEELTNYEFELFRFYLNVNQKVKF